MNNPYSKKNPPDTVANPPPIKRTKVVGMLRLPVEDDDSDDDCKVSGTPTPTSIRAFVEVTPDRSVVANSVARLPTSNDNEEDTDDDDMIEPERQTLSVPVVNRNDIDQRGWVIKTYSYTRKDFTGDGLEKLVRQRDSWSSDACPVRTTNDTYQFQERQIEMRPVQIFGLEGVVENIVSNRLNTITRDLFGDTLLYLGIGRLDHAGDLSIANEDGSMSVSNRSLTFFATVYPMVNQQASFQNRQGIRIGDPRCWNNHILNRKKGSETMKILELAVKVFSCFLPEGEKRNHLDAIENKEGPFINGDSGFALLTAYDAYATVVAKIMSMPVVRAAMKFNWSPVLCLKDVIHQVDPKYGIRGTRIATCAATNKSFICLVGFHRQRSVYEHDFECISMLNHGAPITLKTQAFIRLPGGIGDD